MIRPLWAAVLGLAVAAGAVLAAGPGNCCLPWAGIYPTVLTPWNCDCTVDDASLEAQLRYQVAGGSIVVAAMGPSESDLNEVTAVIRVKNRVDPSTSPRVAQAGAVAARVTADNVNPREFLEWIQQYLQTERRSEPIFRNGWRITVSGSAAEGRKDPKPQLGTAVMIEMKK